MIGILAIPFLGTLLGSAMVFLLKNEINKAIEKALSGFAAGVMMAASVWSLLIPCLDMSGAMGRLSFIPAVVGFLAGIFFLLILDITIPHLHAQSGEKEGRSSNLSNSIMLVFAVTLHNIPEGMAVGVSHAWSSLGPGTNEIGALALAIGIAIQNFPEGAIISMPLINQGVTKGRAFLYGALSGIVEPIGALLIIILAKQLTPILPYFLSFSAGAMIYVVVEELIPGAQSGKHTNVGTIGTAFGFALMMALDVALG